MDSLQYLTVQDLLWINLQVTGAVQRYDFAKLEEGTFTQYAYGESVNLLPQAASFLKGFAQCAPFERGNQATAWVAFVAFLAINGRHLKLSDAEAPTWLTALKASPNPAQEIESVTESKDHHGEIDVREQILQALATYKQTLNGLEASVVA